MKQIQLDYALLALVIIIVVASVVGAVVVWLFLAGPDNLVTEEIEFIDFSIVKASHAFEVDIIQSSSFSINITASEYVDVARTGEDEYERKHQERIIAQDKLE